jgi:hypothetical protein
MSDSLVNLPAPSPIKRKFNSVSNQGQSQYIQKRVTGYFSTEQSYFHGTVTSFQNNRYRIKYDDGDEEDVALDDPDAPDGRDLIRMLDNYARLKEETGESSVQDGAIESEKDDVQHDPSAQMQLVDSILDNSDKIVDSASLSRLSSWVHSSHLSILSSNTMSFPDFIDNIIQLCLLLEETIKAGIRLDLIRESRREYDNGNTKVRSLVK